MKASEKLAITRHTPYCDLPEYLTVEEFIVVTGVGRSHAYDLVRTEVIPALKWGRLFRIPKSVLQIDKA